MRIFRFFRYAVCLIVTCSSEPRDLYDVLGITKEATAQDIKKAYHSSSMKYHPDRNPHPDADEKFKEIANAYEILSDKEKRSRYDALGFPGLETMGGESWGSHPFEGFGFNRQKRKVPSTVINLYVTLEQLYWGDVLDVKYKRSILCPNLKDCTTTRSDCMGPGVKGVTQRLGPGFVIQNQIPDSTCISSGIGWKTKCSGCPSGVMVSDTTSLSLAIAAGTSENETVVYERAGDQAIGMEAGDLIFQVVQYPHSKMVRHGNNLHYELPITLQDSLLGFSTYLPHINGGKFEVKADGVTPDFSYLTVPGQGMPTSRDGYGEAVILMRVKFPKSIPSEQKESLKKALDDREWMNPQVFP